jgi:hypothetical protein
MAAGNEPLGLVTALFVAGASSVLGTLWPIYSSTGRRFAIHFYQSIEKQRIAVEARTVVKVKVLNLALAVQEATIIVKKGVWILILGRLLFYMGLVSIYEL